MRRLSCTVFAVAATSLVACSTPASTPPTTPADPAAPGASAPLAATSAAPTVPARKTAADCPTVGAAVDEPGPPSVGKPRHEEIVAIMQKHRDKFRCCYDVARREAPAQGNYFIEAILKPDGTIKQITPRKEPSEIKSQTLDDCAVAVMRSLKFSANAEGKETTVPYQFGFTPGGGGK